MAVTFTRILLSGSTNGRVIPVAAIATPGTLIHTAVAGTASFDEIYLWANNASGVDATLTLEWGGVTNPGDIIALTVVVPANSPPTRIIEGEVLNNGLILRAFSGTASVINLSGYVNRIA